MSSNRNTNFDSIFSLFNSNNRNILLDILTILNDDNYEILLNEYINNNLEYFNESSSINEEDNSEDTSVDETDTELNDEDFIEEESELVLNMDPIDMNHYLERNILPNLFTIGNNINTERNSNQALNIEMYDKFEKYRIWGWNLKEDTCCICLNSYKWLYRVVKLPCCNKEFHEDCLNSWFLSHSTCPLCRKNLNPDNQDTDILGMIHRMMNITRSAAQIIDHRISNQL